MKKKIDASPLSKRLLKELGVNLKIARLRRNLSLKILAQRVGVSINTLGSLEKGVPGVSIGLLANVLQVLSLSNDLINIAKEDELGRKLQDINLLAGKRPRRIKK